jgi:hypothetical protein
MEPWYIATETFTSRHDAWTNVPDVFDNNELSSKGLLTSQARAFDVQSKLKATHPDDPHADCHVWAIFRAVAS